MFKISPYRFGVSFPTIVKTLKTIPRFTASSRTASAPANSLPTASSRATWSCTASSCAALAFAVASLTVFFLTTAWTVTPANAQIVDSGQINEEVPRTDARILGWATGVFDFERGWIDYQNPEAGRVSFGEPTDALGANGTPFSLGDGGWITFSFDEPIGDGDGIDFAVFENGFEAAGGVYMELGFVEVSTNGVDFVRLPNLARRETQPGPFEASPSADFYNLAGNFVDGTGVDLADLFIDPDPRVLDGTIDVGHINYVRVRDVVGDIAGPGTTFDTLGRAVADPYPTAFGSGGMDITGLAILNPPTPAAAPDEIAHGWARDGRPTLTAYPNPFQNSVRLELEIDPSQDPGLEQRRANLRSIEILDAQGRRVAKFSAPATALFLDWDGRSEWGRDLPQGTYFVRARSQQATFTTTIRKVQ